MIPRELIRNYQMLMANYVIGLSGQSPVMFSPFSVLKPEVSIRSAQRVYYTLDLWLIRSLQSDFYYVRDVLSRSRQSNLSEKIYVSLYFWWSNSGNSMRVTGGWEDDPERIDS